VRRVLAALLAGGFTLAGCSFGDDSFDLKGAAYRPIFVPDASYCTSTPIQITVTDQNGTVVATGYISSGSLDANKLCEFPFSIHVPQRSFYQLSSPGQTSMDISLAQAKAGGVSFKL